MSNRILNFGSLNIDYVYQVPHFVRPGETISSQKLETHAGGKGANQSTALARAGAKVFHAGKIGKEGTWLKDNLAKDGVNVHFIQQSEGKNGHACIQVDVKGQNAILLYAGANKEITEEQIHETISHFSAGDYLLLQNEINFIPQLIELGAERGLHVCFNPAPMNEAVLKYPLDKVKTLILNETEACTLADKQDLHEALQLLVETYPETELILTLGDHGVQYRYKNDSWDIPVVDIKVVDTTGAGDTFIGYFLAARLKKYSVEKSLRIASQASALCVSKPGAQDSIPYLKELEEHFKSV